MNFVTKFIIFTFSLFVLQFFLPWWIVAPISGMAGYFLFHSLGQSFLGGFIGAGLPWLMLSLIEWSRSNGILANKVGEMFGGLPGISLVLVVTVFIGLLGGIASVAGTSLKKALQ